MKYNNIYWFLLDGLSPTKLNSCGNTEVESNFIDGLLSKGSTFSYVYSAEAGTHTSMHVFFSSLYSSINGATGWTKNVLRKFDPEIFTITDYLKKLGYKTFRYCDAKGERTAPMSGFDMWESSGFKIGTILNNTDFTKCPNRDKFIDKVNKEQAPKFVYHHIELLHDLNENLGIVWGSSDYIKNIKTLSENFEKLYSEYNITEDDLVIVSSDHGVLLDIDYRQTEILNGQRHEEISARAFFSISGKDIPQKVLPRLVSAIHIGPTLLDIAASEKMYGLGKSLTRYMYNDEYEPHHCFREKGSYFVPPQSPEKADTWCVRDEKWKYVFCKTNPKSEWLIDLENDEDYTKNLLSEHPEIRDKYRTYIFEELIDNKKKALDIYKEQGFTLRKRDINPVISVFVTLKYVNPCIVDSLLDLAGPYYELIIVASKKLNKELENYKSHPKVKIINDNNITIKDALNEARGEYIIFANGNYEYEEFFINDLFQALLDNPSAQSVVTKDKRGGGIYTKAFLNEHGNNKLFKYSVIASVNQIKLDKDLYRVIEVENGILKRIYSNRIVGDRRIITILGIKFSHNISKDY